MLLLGCCSLIFCSTCVRSYHPDKYLCVIPLHAHGLTANDNLPYIRVIQRLSCFFRELLMLLPLDMLRQDSLQNTGAAARDIEAVRARAQFAMSTGRADCARLHVAIQMPNKIR